MAAYCVSVLNEEMNRIAQIQIPSSSPAYGYAQGMYADDDKLRKRYQLYLLAMADMSNMGILVAIQRGKIDFQQCSDAIQQCAPKNCAPMPSQCAMPMRCRDPGSLLPFPF